MHIEFKGEPIPTAEVKESWENAKQWLIDNGYPAAQVSMPDIQAFYVRHSDFQRIAKEYSIKDTTEYGDFSLRGAYILGYDQLRPLILLNKATAGPDSLTHEILRIFEMHLDLKAGQLAQYSKTILSS